MSEELYAAQIQEAVRKKYAEISRSAEGKFNYPTGRAGALMLGYDPSFIEGLPVEVIESFCGVGNPFTLGPINRGETVLDVGCGAGFDLLYASRMVGSSGKVLGIDLTPEMVDKARRNLKEIGLSGFEIQSAGTEAIPFHDGTIDVVISNGVLNLSPFKERSFREIHRVLKSGGRLQFADIVLKDEAAASRANSLESWSD
ncbi:MAG TPA: methyltransferase domain-containing protein [Thermodesulfovibrionales bacterium]|nr:methyltransferase domain-containing protein [Thermodesulfovibrionales bacterium]